MTHYTDALRNLLTTPGVYAVRSSQDGKVYIGSSTAIYARCRDHYWRLLSERHPNGHLQSAWTRDGSGFFTVEVLESLPEATIEELRQAEERWIMKLQDRKS